MTRIIREAVATFRANDPLQREPSGDRSDGSEEESTRVLNALSWGRRARNIKALGTRTAFGLFMRTIQTGLMKSLG